MSWKEIDFKDFITLQRGFDLTASNMKEGDVPVMGSSGIVGFHNEFKVSGPGVVTGRSGTLGFVQYTDADYWPHNTSLWVKDFKGNNPRFVYYMLKTLRLERFNGGASVPTLNRNVLDHLKLKVPSSSKKQEKISSALLKYDELIKINEKKIALLEESARLIYKEWFVYLRYPDHEKMSQHFKTKLVKDLIQIVPKPKKILAANYLKEGSIPCIDQSRDFVNGYTDDADAEINVDSPVVLFGDHTRVLKFINFNFAAGADGTQLIQPVDESITVEYLYYALLNINLPNSFYARHLKFLKACEILVPEISIQKKYSQVVSTKLKQITLLRNINRQLTKARDLILPRLMNGDIEI